MIRAVTAKHVNLNPETSVLEQIDINVEVEYNGGIQLAIDASSRFSKAAMVKIKGMSHFVCIVCVLSCLQIDFYPNFFLNLWIFLAHPGLADIEMKKR